MSKVRDFNLVKASDVTTTSTSTNTNSVSVVVNADTSGANNNNNAGGVNFTSTPTPQLPTQTVHYTPVQDVEMSQSILPREANVELPQNTEEVDSLKQELEFYKLLSSILSSILKDNNPKLIINLIDTSGKIIITGEQLIELIAIKTRNDKNNVNIQYKDEEPGCLSKVNPIKNISNIKINNETFSLKYNADYNIIRDDFNISLDKVIINPAITYGH